MIKAIQFIKTGFSADDAKKLDMTISPLFETKQKIVVDFEGITIFTTLFFNNTFAKYLLQISPQKYDEMFSVINLSELGQATYQHSINNAINYYNLSEQEKKVQEENLSKLEE